jgi:hypothetical protein
MKTIVLGLHFALTALSANAGPAEDIASLATKIEKKLQLSRYMEGKCVATQVPGWEGFPTQKCLYKVTDVVAGSVKPGLVVMLNPTALKLSEWAVNACKKVRPKQPTTVCATYVVNRVIAQSGGQFPVAGVVYEDLIPKDGVKEAYGFRDGVTVFLDGVKHRRTTVFSALELEAALAASVTQTVSVDAYARVVGVSRQEFVGSNPDASVDGLNWLSVVRNQYQKAWNSGTNALVEAWLRANPQ